MIRYLRLYAYFVRFSFSKAMEFRLDFFFRIFMDCVYYAVNISFYVVIFRHTNLIGSWSLEQVYVFVGGFFVLDAIMMTIFSNNTWGMPSQINKGNLDHYLVKPVSSLFFLSLREFAANSFMNLVIAVAFWIWAIANYSAPWDLGHLIVYVILIINGTLLHYIVTMLAVLPVFWSHAPGGFTDLMMSLNSFMERPDQIFDGWLRKVLLTILPYSLMASFPAQIFFDRELNLRAILHIAIVTTILFSLVLWIWKKGLRAYTSASS